MNQNDPRNNGWQQPPTQPWNYGAPQQQYPPQFPPPMMYGPPKPPSGIGTAALIFAILFPFLGFILGIVAACTSHPVDKNRGGGAIFLSIIMFFVYAAILVAASN